MATMYLWQPIEVVATIRLQSSRSWQNLGWPVSNQLRLTDKARQMLGFCLVCCSYRVSDSCCFQLEPGKQQADSVSGACWSINFLWYANAGIRRMQMKSVFWFRFFNKLWSGRATTLVAVQCWWVVWNVYIILRECWSSLRYPVWLW